MMKEGYYGKKQLDDLKQQIIADYEKELERKESNRLKFKGDLERHLDSQLKANFRNAHERINQLGVPRISVDRPMPSLDMINSVLENVKTAVYSSFCKNEYIPGNIYNDLLSKDVTMLYDSIAEKITYGIIFGTSQVMLGYLLYYVNRDFLFSYIKDRIVRPTLPKEVERLKARIDAENSLSKDERLNLKRYDVLVSFVNELMVGMDYERASDLLADLTDLKLDYETCKSFLDDMDLFVPDFVYDIFSPDNAKADRAADEMTDFLKKYIVTFTKSGLIELFKAHTTLNRTFMEKVEQTILEREKMHNLFTLDLVDGMNLLHLKLANKLCKLSELSEEEIAEVERTPNLRNIRTAIDMYKEFDTQVKLEGTSIIITSSLHDPKTIYYTKNDMMDKLKDPFNIFGKNREYVKTTWKYRPLQSCLTQTVITSSERKRIYYNDRELAKLATVEGRVNDRNNKIRQLIAKLEYHDPKLISEARELLENGPKKLEFINPYQTDCYENLGDERTTLMVLCETEGLYRKIVNYKEPVIQTKPEVVEEQPPQKTIEEVYEHIRRASRERLGFPPVTYGYKPVDKNGRMPSPVYEQFKRKNRQSLY